jgi:four helix bundle protein
MNDSVKKNKKNGFDIQTYRLVFETSMKIHEEIFEKTKNFPLEKRFLIDQLRKYSKLVCIYLAEAWRMKKNRSFLINKLSAAEQAATKVQIWLEYSWKSNYINENEFQRIDSQYENIFEILCCAIDNN